MLAKLTSIMVEALCSSGRLRHPQCKKEGYRRSFIPTERAAAVLTSQTDRSKEVRCQQRPEEMEKNRVTEKGDEDMTEEEEEEEKNVKEEGEDNAASDRRTEAESDDSKQLTLVPAADPHGPHDPDRKWILVTIAAGAGAVGAVVLAPVALGAVGFTSAGIAAGSYAAGMMSSAAIANGGGVAAGSLVAVLQSAGAAGLSAAASTAVAGVGGAVGGAMGWLTSVIARKKKQDKAKLK